MKIKLGIIGYGGMGKWHAANASRAGVEIAAVCDIEKEKIDQGIADGFKTYTNAEDLLKDPDVNTVVLTVPNHLLLLFQVQLKMIAKWFFIYIE